MEKPKPFIGMRLFSLPAGNSRRRSQEPTLNPVVVTKIGRSYFYAGPEGCREHQICRYHLDSWHEAEDMRDMSSILYVTEQEYAEEKEASAICKTLKHAFEYGSNHRKLPLNALRAIMEIINREQQL